jgi:hypothetical protein
MMIDLIITPGHCGCFLRGLEKTLPASPRFKLVQGLPDSYLNRVAVEMFNLNIRSVRRYFVLIL